VYFASLDDMNDITKSAACNTSYCTNNS